MNWLLDFCKALGHPKARVGFVMVLDARGHGSAWVVNANGRRVPYPLLLPILKRGMKRIARKI